MNCYYPKSMPYNMYINDAITWYQNELLKINTIISTSKNYQEIKRLENYKKICEYKLGEIQEMKNLGIKKVNLSHAT